MIKRYEAKNFIVIIDDVIDDDQVEEYTKHFNEVHAFLLLPRLEVLRKRDAERVPDKQMVDRVDVLYHELSAKKYEVIQVIDSSNHTVDETVQEIKGKITDTTK